MFHYVYRTTVTTRKGSSYYFGKHSTKNLKDGYIGSGVRIQKIKKNINEYSKDPEFSLISDKLCFFETTELALEFEELLVSEAKEKLGRKCLNVAKGGKGDPLAYKTSEEIEQFKRNVSRVVKGRKLSEITRKRMSIAKSGRTLSGETKQKLSNLKKGVKTNILPWLSGMSMKSESSQRMWSIADKIYDVWIQDEIGHRKLKYKCIDLGLADESMNFNNLVKWFKDNNPHEHELPKRNS